jgi:3-deoxy-D-manno-octulosonate 8-phosphate phosphatase (KDO 8-P phosphatase)
MLEVGCAVASRIKLLVLDVDGVLTDAQIVLGLQGEEIKAFSARDGIGIKLAQFAGIEIAFISARASEIVARRAETLGVTEVHQGEKYKLPVVRRIARERGLDLSQVAYVGDDLVDLESIAAAGLGVAVGDACRDVMDATDYVTETPGGRGAVRETIEAILRARGDWDTTVRGFLSGT